MPITQDRMIALLNAGSTLLAQYEALLKRAETHFDQAQQETRRGQALDALSELGGLLDTIRSFAPSASVAIIIGEERGHFNSRRKYNEKTAEYMRRRRRSAAQAHLDVDAPHEIQLPREPLDLAKVKSQLQQLWLRSDPESINIHIVCDMIADFGGPKDPASQQEIITEMTKENFLLPYTRFGFPIAGEFILNSNSEPPKAEADSRLEVNN